MTLRQQIEHALADGPGTSYELSFAVGHDSRRLNAYLRDLWQRGHIQRWLHNAVDRGPGLRHRVWMYGAKL